MPSRRWAARPAGTRGSASRRFWTPLRWLVLLTLLDQPARLVAEVALPGARRGRTQYQYTRGCYTDVFALYFAERLNEGKTPYLEHPVEYPVVIGAVMQVAATAVSAFAPDERPRHFYDVTWVLLTACALVVVVTTARLAGRRRPWDAAIFAAAPLLVLHGTHQLGPVAMALAGLGLLPWARSRPLAAGVLLGARDRDQALPGAVPRAAARAVPAGRPAAGVRGHRGGAGRSRRCCSACPST